MLAPKLTTALQFGGGKDSLACLTLFKDQLDDILDVLPVAHQEMRRFLPARRTSSGDNII